jgi:hypothetical protein
MIYLIGSGFRTGNAADATKHPQGPDKATRRFCWRASPGAGGWCQMWPVSGSSVGCRVAAARHTPQITPCVQCQITLPEPRSRGPRDLRFDLGGGLARG